MFGSNNNLDKIREKLRQGLPLDDHELRAIKESANIADRQGREDQRLLDERIKGDKVAKWPF